MASAHQSRAALLRTADYLLLDLFSMPVVEPYPISEPLSTAGRINMNYQIVPSPTSIVIRASAPS